METSTTGSPKARSLRPHLQLVIPYTTPELTRAALKSAAVLAQDLGATMRLVGVHVVPYPCPLDHPDVANEHLKNKLAAVAWESALPVRAEVVYGRDRQAAFRQVLGPGALVLLATRKHWWRTAQERLARSLSRAGHSVALLVV